MNSILQRLGYSPNDRVLIIHADDIGMCQATLPAIADLFEFGVVSSAALMAPCPWFPQAAAFCRAHPSADVGVHLTLNCEWVSYRWAPIATRDAATGLLDEQGYFHQWPAATFEHADAAAVAAELEAQVQRALAAGVDPTHADAHMGTAMHPRFLAEYLRLAERHRLPPMLLANPAGHGMLPAGDAAAVAEYARLAGELSGRGVPLFDDIRMLPLDNPADHVGVMKQIVDELRPGLTMLILHPAQDTPELRAIAPDWRCRAANYAACMSADLRDHIRASGVDVIGYRPLRDAMRAGA
jgi:predicted glycoside hydrolase/deacetylase ChbG (UPF0249 family)